MDILDAYFVEMRRRGMTDRTYEVYHSLLHRFLIETYGERPIKSQIRATDMREWLEKKPLRPSSYNSDITRFRSFCNVLKIKYKKDTLAYKKVREVDRMDRQDYLTHDQVLGHKERFDASYSSRSCSHVFHRA